MLDPETEHELFDNANYEREANLCEFLHQFRMENYHKLFQLSAVHRELSPEVDYYGHDILVLFSAEALPKFAYPLYI